MRERICRVNPNWRFRRRSHLVWAHSHHVESLRERCKWVSEDGRVRTNPDQSRRWSSSADNDGDDGDARKDPCTTLEQGSRPFRDSHRETRREIKPKSDVIGRNWGCYLRGIVRGMRLPRCKGRCGFSAPEVGSLHVPIVR